MNEKGIPLGHMLKFLGKLECISSPQGTLSIFLCSQLQIDSKLLNGCDLGSIRVFELKVEGLEGREFGDITCASHNSRQRKINVHTESDSSSGNNWPILLLLLVIHLLTKKQKS